MTGLLKDSHERLRTTMADLKRVYRNTRATDSRPEKIDLRNQIDGALMLMQQRLASLDVIVDIHESAHDIMGRPAEIQHVIVNLIDNAAQALGDSGRIRLKARPEGQRVMFVVEDSGPGVPFDQRERIFEPFFTTREQGSGLGLSVVRRNVENNKATIRVGQSELGGALFEIGFRMATQ